MDIIEIIVDLPLKLKELAEVLKAFIFDGVQIGGTTYSIWLLLAGVGIVALIIFSIVRN